MRSTWDQVWADVAEAVARRSACDRSQVGAVIVRDKRVVSTGYNGPAAGYPVDTDLGCSAWCERAKSRPSPETGYGFYCPSIHAEANALMHASREETVGATLYCTHAPCADCAKLISNSGVARVVMLRAPEAHRPDSYSYLLACGIEVVLP